MLCDVLQYMNRKGKQMRDVNKVTLLGRAGADGEVKDTNGGSVGRIRLATGRSWKDKASDEWKSKTEWHNVVCWGQLAEKAAMVKKGDVVYVDGSVEYREFKEKHFTDIKAFSVEVFTSEKKVEKAMGGSSDDDLPF